MHVAMLVRKLSPLTRKRARRAAGTRDRCAEELADVTSMLPDDLLLLLVRWRRHAHPPTSATTCPSPALAATLTSRIVAARATRPLHAAAAAAFTTPPTSPALPNSPAVASSPGAARRRPHYPWRRCAIPQPKPHPHPRPNSHPSPNPSMTAGTARSPPEPEPNRSPKQSRSQLTGPTNPSPSLTRCAAGACGYCATRARCYGNRAPSQTLTLTVRASRGLHLKLDPGWNPIQVGPRALPRAGQYTRCRAR